MIHFASAEQPESVEVISNASAPTQSASRDVSDRLAELNVNTSDPPSEPGPVGVPHDHMGHMSVSMSEVHTAEVSGYPYRVPVCSLHVHIRQHCARMNALTQLCCTWNHRYLR